MRRDNTFTIFSLGLWPRSISGYRNSHLLSKKIVRMVMWQVYLGQTRCWFSISSKVWSLKASQSQMDIDLQGGETPGLRGRANRRGWSRVSFLGNIELLCEWPLICLGLIIFKIIFLFGMVFQLWTVHLPQYEKFYYTIRIFFLNHPVEHWAIDLFSFSCVSCRECNR